MGGKLKLRELHRTDILLLLLFLGIMALGGIEHYWRLTYFMLQYNTWGAYCREYIDARLNDGGW